MKFANGWSCLLSQDAVVEMLSQGYRVDSQALVRFLLGIFAGCFGKITLW